MSYITTYTISTLDDIPGNLLPASCDHKFDKSYNFCPDCGKPKINSIIVEELAVNFIQKLHTDWGNFDPFSNSCKWYEHDNDMLALSRAYPGIVFKLHGEGEESGDIWNKYYKNGKVQKAEAKITYDEFDENKLR